MCSWPHGLMGFCRFSIGGLHVVATPLQPHFRISYAFPSPSPLPKIQNRRIRHFLANSFAYLLSFRIRVSCLCPGCIICLRYFHIILRPTATGPLPFFRLLHPISLYLGSPICVKSIFQRLQGATHAAHGPEDERWMYIIIFIFFACSQWNEKSAGVIVLAGDSGIIGKPPRSQHIRLYIYSSNQHTTKAP